MKYERVIQYVASEPWAILPEKMTEIVGVLAHRAAGEVFSAEEIEARIGGGSRSPVRRVQGAVAVLPIHGTIAHRIGSMEAASGGISTEQIGAMVRDALANDQVGAIVLDVNSPGGTVAGVPELASELLALRGQKPIVAVANATMASAAYWIAAAAADEIVATPSASVGSIGVFAVHQDVTKALEQAGITVNVIKAGKYKAEGLFEALTPEARAVLQDRVDEAYAQFVDAVAKGRGVSAADVRNGYGEGRTLPAKAAKAAGLVDRVATLDETITRLTGRSAAPMGARADDVTPADLALAEYGFRFR